MTPPAAVLDIDGTLVDSNYLHVVSWHEAFRQFGIELPVYLDLLGVRDDVEGWTTSADVQDTKPEPDVIKGGLEKLGKAGVGGGDPLAVMIGDSIFDVEAAGRAGLPTLALRTGGFGADELSELGAVAVFSSLEELREGYGKTPLSG